MVHNEIVGKVIISNSLHFIAVEEDKKEAVALTQKKKWRNKGKKKIIYNWLKIVI